MNLTLLEKTITDAIFKQREMLLAAFIAETGALPSECVQIIETVGNAITMRIEKRKEKL